MCPLYVAGLVSDPAIARALSRMAERLAPGDYDQLHQAARRFLRLASGTRRHWRQSCSFRRDQLSWWQRHHVGNRAIRRCRRRARTGSRRRCAIRFSARQDRQLPNSGVTDARPRRSSGDGGIAAFPSRQLGQRSAAAEASWVFRPNIELHGQSPRSHWRRLISLISIGVRFRCVLADAGYGAQLRLSVKG